METSDFSEYCRQLDVGSQPDVKALQSMLEFLEAFRADFSSFIFSIPSGSEQEYLLNNIEDISRQIEEIKSIMNSL